MDNFTFHRPTDFVFGKDAQSKAGEYLKKYGATKVFIHYGGGSVIKSGLLDQVKASLNAVSIPFVELGGVVPNPEDTLVYKGIDMCRAEGVDFILAVGGGSVIDSAKAIAVGVPYDGDFWDFYDGKGKPTTAVKLATVLTIPAAGSEVSESSVITKVGDTPLKRGLNSPHMTPVFSLMNPELNYTLPAFQTACGVADMMSHLFERYFTNTTGVLLTDELAEGILRTVIHYAPIAIKEPNNYEARANLTWAGCIAHDNSTGVGRAQDWGSHMLEHELSAMYGVAHGAGLATVFPAWMSYVQQKDQAAIERFARFATKVWGVECDGDLVATGKKGIEALRNFWAGIGLPVNFEQLGAKKEDIPAIVKVLELNTGGSFSSFKRMDMSDAAKIYELAAQ